MTAAGPWPGGEPGEERVTPLATRRLGRSPVRVTELSLGGAAIGNLFNEVPDTDARAAVDAAWDGGIRAFDTAPHYGLGLSERRLGDALRHRPRDQYVISTKVGRLLEPAGAAGTPGRDTEGFAVPARYVRRFDFGAGVLVGRGDWMDGAPPYLAGGGAVRQVGLDATDWAASPARHEGGTPNVIGAVAVAAACRFIDSLPAGAVDAREGFLTDRLVAGLSAIDGVRTLRLWPASAPRPARAAALAGRRPGGPALALRRLGGVPWPACGEAPDEFFQRVEFGGA